MAREGPNGAETALEAALARVGDRWSLLVVQALLGGSRRWRELQESVPGIAPNILSDRLKRLEREAVITARPYSERPVRMMYELTGAGQELGGALRLLADWGARRSPVAEPLRHSACGTPMEARWFCSTCARPVAEEEAQEVRYV
jgi:DNA-binding HxlR family transcriptional regulator